MTQMLVPLKGGEVALVCDDWDDWTVWAHAKEHGCAHVLMVPDATDWLAEHIDPVAVGLAGGVAALPRLPGRPT